MNRCFSDKRPKRTLGNRIKINKIVFRLQSEQRTNVDNSYGLEMYGLVNKITGRSDIYDNIQTMAAYPSSHQRQYLKASEQRSNNNNRNAVELYELVQFIGGGNNVNGW
jgi:hypothetical protein